MSVRREEYIVLGCKLNEEFTDNLFKGDETFYEKILGEYGWKKNNEYKIQMLIDGMNGDYTFFGFITQLNNGYEENYDITEILEITFEQKELIKLKFNELFPDIKMPEIKAYHVPHYC